jgi:ribosomal protein S18 acetylase RimI-like enzyme
MLSAQTLGEIMNHTINLRAALQEDEPFLLLLRKLTMNGHLTRAGQPVDDDAHYQRVRTHFDDARIICCGLKRIGLVKAYRSESEWVILQIQVLPDHQRKGIGEWVVRGILMEAGQAGLPVSLSVLKGNPARRLYERMGFELVSQTDSAFRLVWQRH